MTDILSNGRSADNVQTIATSLTPVTLTDTSGPYVRFTGSVDQKVILPDVTTLFPGQAFVIMNRSTGNISVYKNDGTSFVGMVYAGKEGEVRLIDNSDSWDIFKTADQTVVEPLKLSASAPASAILNISGSFASTDDGAGKAASAIDGTVVTIASSTINMQTGAITGASILLGVGGPALTFPYTPVGQYRRLVFAAQKDGSITTSFSSAQASLGSLTNAGDLLTTLNGLALGYIDLEATAGAISFTFLPAAVSTSLETIAINLHGFSNGQTVSFSSTGTLPGGLSAATTYYIVNATLADFQVSTTSGGAAVDLTSQGTGVHTITIHSFKTAGSTTNVIENEVGGVARIIRFGSGGGGSLNLRNGGVETKIDTSETTYSIDSGKVNMHPFMHVQSGHTLTVPSGARLLSTDDTIDGTVVVNSGGVWKVL